MNYSCGKDCASCGGCAKTLMLCQPEIDILCFLAQVAFLPVARRADDMTPVYLEQTEFPAQQYSQVLVSLERKGLISLDYDKPLKGFDMTAYAQYPVHGSFALTARGQEIVQVLELQGIEE